MKRIYQDDSYKKSLETMVSEVSIFEGKPELLCEELIFHPAGGGQPDDFGSVSFGTKSYPVVSLRKHKGSVSLVLAAELSLAQEFGFGDTVLCEIDWDRRYRLMRLHSAVHLTMAAARKHVKGYVPGGMQILDDLTCATIQFKKNQDISSDLLPTILSTVREAIQADLGITTMNFPSLEAAKIAGGELFRADPDLQIKGNVRIVIIDSLDFNPCGGTHLKSTKEVGELHNVTMTPIDGGYCKIEFSLNL